MLLLSVIVEISALPALKIFILPGHGLCLFLLILCRGYKHVNTGVREVFVELEQICLFSKTSIILAFPIAPIFLFTIYLFILVTHSE